MNRSSLLILLALPMLAGRAAAQGFEGTITMSLATIVADRPMDASIKTATRGDRTVTTLVMGATAGPMAGTELKTITDRKAKTLTTMTAMPPGMPPSMTGGGNTKGFVKVEPLSNTANMGGMGTDTHPVIRKLGTSQTIAGLRCDDYEITEQKATPIRACVTTALGAFVFPMSGRGAMGGPGASSQGWDAGFGDKPGFPLKVWGGDGKVTLQVTAIDKTPVSESAFAIPEGYVTKPGRGLITVP